MFYFSFCVKTRITPTRGVAVEVPYNQPVFDVWLKNLEIGCFVGRTVEVTDGQVLSGRMSFTVMYSVSAFSDLWISVDGMLVLTSVSIPPLGLSALSARCISRVFDQNGVSPLYIMLEIHHSGWEPSNFHIPGRRICACC